MLLGTLQAALAALSGSTPTQAQLDAANNALTALNNAITGGADLTDDEKAPYQREANNAAAPIQTAQTAFNNAEGRGPEGPADAAMAVTAAKLFCGHQCSEWRHYWARLFTATDRGRPLTTPPTPPTPPAPPASPANSAVGHTHHGEHRRTAPPAPTTAAALSEDKNTVVADNHGWGRQEVRAYEARLWRHIRGGCLLERRGPRRRARSSAALQRCLIRIPSDFQYQLGCQRP